MRCNACWRELEGRAISTTCFHLLCTEDANKISSSDGACPICDQVLSKSHMKVVDLAPNEEWIKMAMTGISPDILMKSMHRSIMFYIGQKELVMQRKLSMLQGQYRQKCESMQEKFMEQLQKMQFQCQKLAKKCEMLEQETESFSKDKQELQEKYSEKSRQKRKLDEMYDQLRSEYESNKRNAIQPASNFYSRNEPDLFSNQTNIMDHREPVRLAPVLPKPLDSLPADWRVRTPETPGPKENIWPGRKNSSISGSPFDISVSPANQPTMAVEAANKRPGAQPMFGSGAGNSSSALRNILFSPIKRPQPSRRPQIFTF